MEDYLITVTQEADEVIRLAVGISDAEYWVGEASADLSSEIVVNNEASLYDALSDVTDFVQPGDAAHDGFADFVAEEHIDWTIDQGAVNIDDANIAETAVTQHEAAIDHTEIANIGANSHTQIDTALTRLIDTSGANTGDISLDTTSHDYLSLLGQEITLDAIDLTADVTGELPVANVANLSGTNTGDQSAGDFSHGSLADLSTGADHSYIDQDVTAGASPNFDGANITGILASALGGVLQDLDTLGAATADGEFIVATGAGAFAYESGATVLASLGLSPSDSIQLSTIELGHASDTTLSRSAAGVLAVEGVDALLADGSIALTADWDIGDGIRIETDEIRARDGAGLKLFNDGGEGVFVADSGDIEVNSGLLDIQDGFLTVTSAFVSHGVTSVLEDDQAFILGKNNNNGGFEITAASESSATPAMYFDAVIGAGSASVGAIEFRTSRASGTGRGDLSGDEIAVGYKDASSNFKMVLMGDGSLGLSTTPDTILDINGAFTFRELSSDPDDPDEGAAVLWMSDGSDTGSEGDILMKITAGGVTKTTTRVDFSAL